MHLLSPLTLFPDPYFIVSERGYRSSGGTFQFGRIPSSVPVAGANPFLGIGYPWGQGVAAGFVVVCQLSTSYSNVLPFTPGHEGVNNYDYNGSWSGNLVLRSRSSNFTDFDVEEFRYPIQVEIVHHFEEVLRYVVFESGGRLVRDSMQGYNHRTVTCGTPIGALSIEASDLAEAPFVGSGSDSYVFPDMNWFANPYYGDGAREAQRFKGSGENGGIYSGDVVLPPFQFPFDPARDYQLRVEGNSSSSATCSGEFLIVFTGFPVAVPAGEEQNDVIILDASASVPHAKAPAYNGLELVAPRPVMKRAPAISAANVFADAADVALSYQWKIRDEVVSEQPQLSYSYEEDDLVLAPAGAAETSRLTVTPYQDGFNETQYQSGVVATLQVTDNYGGQQTTPVFVPVPPVQERLVSGLQDTSGVSLLADVQGTGSSKYLRIRSHDKYKYLERAQLSDYQAPSLLQVPGESTKYLLAQHKTLKVWRLLASNDSGKDWSTIVSEPWDANTRDAVCCSPQPKVMISARVNKTSKVVEIKVSRNSGKNWAPATSPGGGGKSLAIWPARDGTQRVFLSNKTASGATWTKFTDSLAHDPWEDLPA